MRETEIIKWILGNLCIFIIISFGAGCSSGGGWKLEWSDEFNGSNLSPQKWTIVTGGSGFGNGESQYYTARPKNIHVKDGLLLIRAFKERYGTNFYTSAKITTYKKFSMKYGRIEIRARLPCGRGIWPAFWLLPINGEWPETGEIDIMEEDGLMPETVYGTLHFGLPWTYRTRSFSLDKGSFSDNFHVFTLEWEPGEFRWYVDGYLYSKVNEWFSRRKGKQNYCEYPAPFNTDFYLQINLAVGGHFPGPPDRTTVFPQTLAVDYVRIYRKDYYPSMKLNPEGVRDYFSKPLRGLMPDGNLIFNGNFKLKNIIGWQPYSFIDSGMAAKIAENGYWQFLTGSGGIADFKISNGIFGMLVKSPGTENYSIELVQAPLMMEKNGQYELSFYARSDTNRSMIARVSGVGGYWLSYSGDKYCKLNSCWSNYIFTFTMLRDSDNRARLAFEMGQEGAPVYISNVRLVNIRNGVKYH